MPLVCLSARIALKTCSLIGLKKIPTRSVPLPTAARRLPRSWPRTQTDTLAPLTIVYFPSCLSRSMHSNGIGAPEALHKLCSAAGVGIVVPSDTNALCCGQPFASKGHPEIARSMQQRISDSLRSITKKHDRILAIDTSTCASQLEALEKEFPDWKIVHPAAVISDILLPRLSGKLQAQSEDVILHPTCAEHKHNWLQELQQAGNAAVGNSDSTSNRTSGISSMPISSGCCGMAGDRGWLEPSLTAAATAREGAEAESHPATSGACSNIACGLALEAASGKPYEHIWSLVAKQLPSS